MGNIKKTAKKGFLSKKVYLSLATVFFIAATSVSCSKPSNTAKVENKTEVTAESKNNTSQEKTSETAETTTSSDSKTAAANTNDSKEKTSSTSNTPASKNSTAASTKTASNSSGTSKSTSTAAPAPTTPAATTPAPTSYTYGNTSSNLVNGGFAAYSQNLIYYSNKGLYRSNADGTAPTKISNSSGSCYNIIGDWIYYSSSFGDTGIFKIKKDGSSKTKISSDAPNSISVVNDWIYYQAPSNGNLLLYKIKTDGTNKTKLDFSMNNTLVNIDYPDLVVAGNWIYLDLFNTINHTHGIYRIATDGSSVNKILDGSCYHFCIDGSYIYYIKSGFKEICRANLDGSSPTTLYKTSSEDFGIYSINISNGYIYFSSDSQSSSEQYQGIYRVRIDGSNFTKLSNICTKHLCVVSNWIYFDGSVNNNRCIMRMKVDGTQVSAVN